MQLRVVRPTRGSVWLALLATLEITTGAALAHLAAGRTLPSAGWLVAAALAVFGTGVVVLQRRVGLLGGAVLAGLTQLGLHEVFAALAAAPGAAHRHAITPGAGEGGSMLLAHTCAAVLSVVVWVLHRRALAVVVRRLPMPRVAVAGRLLAEAGHFLPRPALWTDVSPRRGPPRPAGL
ncbi:cell division protein FtsQ [Nocardioides sp. KC13]|uniref:Cell division protein FtsQ n=1 Tax=Nocardioides turkmenicus TaxID=2711220 RepID=A0A6M1RBH3_9ACTN|nr:cell division protein FtsQ [Nocardioides sp. KC13]